MSTFAKWRFNIVGRKAAGRNWEDLLCAAISAALDGNRRWFPDRSDFFSFLKGAMQSISSAWWSQKGIEYGEADLDFVDLDEPQSSSFDRFVSSGPESDPAATTMATLLLRDFEGALEGDEAALDATHLLVEGATPSEITEQLNISPGAYDAIKKRLRRKLRKLLVRSQPDEQPVPRGGPAERQ